ncbi:MAG TPA: hypothetical protein VEJ89_14575 [Myxococcaceae bacterium]|jgi:hypothetical protein|nr:hypothetical protein [Myxococcaceae bacterium]
MSRNAFVLFLLVIAGFTGVGIVGWRRSEAQEATLQRDLSAQRLRADALERLGWIRSIPDEKQYREEVQSFFKWYFEAVDAHRKRFGLSPGFDEYLAELEQRKAQEKELENLPVLPDGRRATAPASRTSIDRRAFYAWEKSLFDRMRTGKYQPAFSGTDKGMRLDVVGAEVSAAGGRPRVQLPIVLWGAQRYTKEDERSGAKRVITSADFGAIFRLLDSGGKLVAEMSAGPPGLKNDFPERLIAEFPPQAVLAQYEFDRVPAGVAQMEATFNVRSHAPSGGDANATYTWKTPVPEEWRLGPGETWEGAQESVRSEEDIDPAKAAKAAKAPKR